MIFHLYNSVESELLIHYKGENMANPKDRRESFLFIAWAASVIAMFGSLYFSEIRQYEPCELCWYQRIVMYPVCHLTRNCLH